MTKTPLKIYWAKRDFSATQEPRGKKPKSKKIRKPSKSKKDNPIFVIQKHAARRLHYDFRLEVDGVLKSWAVPKGPSLDPKDRRLAMPTEDHPMEYADFEGVIPKGQYGGGEVIVWDTGTYWNLTQVKGQVIPMKKALEKGHVSFWLEGKKLKGPFTLTRMGQSSGGKTPWLLIKIKEHQPAKEQPVVTRPESVLSGRTIEAIARAAQSKKSKIKIWNSNRE